MISMIENQTDRQSLTKSCTVATCSISMYQIPQKYDLPRNSID